MIDSIIYLLKDCFVFITISLIVNCCVDLT